MKTIYTFYIINHPVNFKNCDVLMGISIKARPHFLISFEL